MNIHTCIVICIYIHTHTYIHTYIHECVHICVYIIVLAATNHVNDVHVCCMHVCMYVSMHFVLCVRMNLFLYGCTCFILIRMEMFYFYTDANVCTKCSWGSRAFPYAWHCFMIACTHSYMCTCELTMCIYTLFICPTRKMLFSNGTSRVFP
jgi:hypothetical protein